MLKIKEEIEKRIKETELQISRYKRANKLAEERSNKAGKYDFTELLDAECSKSFSKAYYMALTRELNYLKHLIEVEE